MKLLIPLFEDSGNAAYKKWYRKNVTLRGVKDRYSPRDPNGMMSSVLGDGLYTAALSNAAMARTYGTLLYVVNAVPKKPLVVNSLNSWEMWVQNNLYKKYDYDRRAFEKETDIKTEMLKLGYDGVIIKGREMVNYKPEDIHYFVDKLQTESYYDLHVAENDEK